MENINKEIGKRLKKVREIMNEGGKLSAEQFAYLLGETRDKIANYESGRASLPVRVLYELYNRGINPQFLLSGEGSIFADNTAGKEFERKINERNSKIKKFSINDVEIENVSLNAENINSNYKIENVAAGKIK